MRPVLIRILKSGLPTALILLVIGFLLSEAAGLWAASQDTRGATSSDAVAAALRQRLPFAMAALGFVLVIAYELLRGLLGIGKSPPPRAAACPAPSASENSPVNN